MSHQNPFDQRKGFVPLPNSNSDNSFGHTRMPSEEIPMTQVRSHQSSHTWRSQRDRDEDGGLYREKTQQENGKNMIESPPGVRGRRRLKKGNSREGEEAEERKLTGMGKLYDKIINFSIITRYLVYILPVAALLAIPMIVGATDAAHDARIGGVRIFWLFLWILVVWLSIWGAKLVAKFLPWVFVFLCGVVSPSTRKYALVLRRLEIPLSLAGWAITSIVTFTALMGRSDNVHRGWIDIMKKILAALLIASLIYLAEKLVVQLISISYHQRSFSLRIQESKRHTHLLSLLYDASRMLFPMYCPEFAEEDYTISDSIEALIAAGVIRKSGRASGSATPMKLIGGLGRLGDKVTSQFGKVAQEISGKEVFNPTSAHSIVTEALEKKRSAEALARRLWMSFVIEGRESLSREDIREVLGPARREEADEAFECIDMDDNGDISLDEMIMKVVGISREAKAIANSMHDISGAIGVLDNVLMVIAGIIIVFVFVAFLNASFVTTLATAGTTLLSLSFVFAVTCQEFLGSCIFLFVKHPYDVGDRVDIKGPEQEALVVEQISLLYTVFRRIDYMKTVQVPNIVLNTMWIENVSRSTAMKEQLELSISFDTSMEDLELLRKEMEAFVRAPENARDFQPDLVLECTGVGTMDKLVLRVEIRHKSNWGNETVRAARRSKFMCALVLALRKIPIFAPGGGGAGLGDPANPSYSVTVTDEMAAAARKKFEEEKEANRLVPSKKPEDEVKGDESSGKSTAVDLGPAREVAAAAALNHRNPGDDRGHDEKSMAALKQEDSNDSRRRSSEIESLREVLVRRQSTRGRRRPGVTIPPTSMGGTNPSLGVIPTSPLSSRLRDDYGRIDEEEAETGMGMQTGNPYTTPAYGQYGLAPPPLNPGAAGGVQQVRSAPPEVQGYQGPSQTQGAQTQPGNNTSSGGGQPNPYLNFPTAHGQGPPAPPK